MDVTVVEVEPREGYTLWLRFDDGVKGEADLSDMIYDDFEVLKDREVFEQVMIRDEGDTVGWSDGVGIFGNELYSKITGLTMDEMYPDLAKQRSKQLSVVEVEPREGYSIWLRFNDGVEGEVDLSDMIYGVFEVLKDREVFEQVHVLRRGRVVGWSNDLDMCADALYMKVTGLSPAEMFPNLRGVPPENLETSSWGAQSSL